MKGGVVKWYGARMPREEYAPPKPVVDPEIRALAQKIVDGEAFVDEDAQRVAQALLRVTR